MTTPTPHAIGAAIVLALLLASSYLLDGPSDIQAAQDMADAFDEAATQATQAAPPPASRITTLNHLPTKEARL
jgi:hypothetical protein